MLTHRIKRAIDYLCSERNDRITTWINSVEENVAHHPIREAKLLNLGRCIQLLLGLIAAA